MRTAAVSQESPKFKVSQNIAVSTTWTCDNVYNLTAQIYVLPGASLTIEEGTVVASTPTANGSGSLAVSKGGQIFVEGTKECPVIMTSTNDTATWTGGDPKTGCLARSRQRVGQPHHHGCGLHLGKRYDR